MYKMIVSPNCPRCQVSKKALSNEGLLDEVELVDVTTDSGLALARQYKVGSAGMDVIDTDSEVKMIVSEFINNFKEQ
jgi:predicted thioredoxin/glutaredoxin